ncbi:hypothetical protein F5144DRAFT_596448 [Chaetomium tenue]|uniref:Uncharacterized protein n=1 Tax=Chaetomium tenue TaxID=1854479 RepID=A0ACB7NVJ5_9PEZI|nr:hypothetical protein F5144DRAFT_596448 [Chaetomium globosum]
MPELFIAAEERREGPACDSGSPTAGTEAQAIDPTPGYTTLSSLISGVDNGEGFATEAAAESDIPAGNGQNPAASGVGDFTDKIEKMKQKLLELERQAQNNRAPAKAEETYRQLTEDMEEYKRMEASLKNHRKEWERETGPGRWGIRDGDPRLYMRFAHRPSNAYEPSSLQELTDEVADGQGQSAAGTYDEFDQIIDYGSRRDRLRKNFEWEMDRMYLAEELDRRRKEKIEVAKAEAIRSEEKKANPATDKPLKGEGQSDAQVPALPKFAKPQLNRVGWAAFRMLSAVEEKDAFVIDILIGEPNVDNDVGGNPRWYGFSGQVRKRVIIPDSKNSSHLLPGQLPLPERVRIHSEALTQILSTILKEEVDQTTVFIRPFKALSYCEPALRDWCTALEKKFEAVPAAEGEETPQEGDSEDEDNQDEDKLDSITKSPTALEHLKCLLSFIDSDISAKQTYLRSPDCRKVLFSDLWQLFRPGMEVTGSSGKQAYRRWSSNTGKRKATRPFSITCLYIDFDGKSLGPVSKVFDIKRFDGERDVTSLEVYPLRFHPVKKDEFSDSEWKELEALPANERYRHKLIRRGAKFLDVASVKHMYYAGPTLETRDEVESQVVIDFETAFSVEDQVQQMWKPELKAMVGNTETEDGEQDIQEKSCNAACCRMDSVHDDFYVDQKQGEEYVNGLLPEAGAINEQPSIAIIPRPLKELRTSSGSSLVSDDELVIMSYRVFGFVLRSRKWAKLDLSYLTDVHLPAAEGDKDRQGGTEEKKTTSFDRLVLEEWHRPMILALIAQHFRDKKSTGGQREEFDVVKGKGTGVTTRLRVPSNMIEVEKALETNFALASRWDCILLLDEADVFLAERTKLDFKRNGLYYSGILFLTTNRIRDFDEAFTSRIHVSLYYPELNDDKTVKVFKLNMSMIRDRFAQKGRRIEIDEMGIGGFAAQHFTAHPHARWNGRQIRNACQTALALAEFEAQGNSHEHILRPDAVVKLGIKQFEVVRNAYIEFSKYMNALYGSNAARRAKEAKVRAIWVDENNNVVADPGAAGGGGMSIDKAAFAAASRRYSYQNVMPTHSSYPDANHRPPAQADQFSPGGQSWENPGGRTAGPSTSANVNANAPYQTSWEGQSDTSAMRQPSPAGGQNYESSPPPQQPQQAYPPGFDRNIQSMYQALGPQAAGQLSPSNLGPGSGNAYASRAGTPGQQW